ncbi:retrovirus-related pol polyprotein from transposon TNT 1-94 [Tanacetum coccineum]
MDSEKEKGSEKKGSKKKSLARKRAGEKQSEESTKRQKIEDDIEKEELKAYLDLVPREEFAMEIKSLGTKDHLGKFDEKADDGFFLGYSLMAKAFRVFNIRRQEIEETVHVTFSEDDEAISQSSTEGDAINFNENRSFPDDEFLEPRSKVTQCPGNIKYFPYIPAYENISPTDSPTLQDSVSPEEPHEFTSADDHPVFNEHDHFDSVENLELAEIQDNVIIEPISGVQSSPTIISPSAAVDINPSPKDAVSAHECLYVNFLSEMEPKKLIEALEEERWIIAMQE